MRLTDQVFVSMIKITDAILEAQKSWMLAMTVNYKSLLDHEKGLWRDKKLIPEGEWIKRITVDGTQYKTAYIVLDAQGTEIASIPIGFSVALLPQS